MLSDASLYSQHRSMQIHDTKLFIDSAISKMNWNETQQEIIMDIGCGPGNSIRNLLLPSFPKFEKIVAVDVIPEMIEFAKKSNAHSKIEYSVANIEDRTTLTQWLNSVTKIVSVYCFNWLNDHRTAFENVFSLLKPGGEAILLFVLSTPFWNSYKAHVENPKWNKYLKNANQHVPESHYSQYMGDHYKQMLENIGFEVIICDDEQRRYVYPDDNDCRAACASRCALTQHIPDQLKAEFGEELFQGFLKHNSRNREGKPVLHYTTLTLLIKKP